MKGYSGAFGPKYWRLATALLILAAVLGPQSVHCQSSGLKIAIGINTDMDQLQIPLGWPVGLTMVIRNETQWSIFTKLGFSQSEFYQVLLLTGPNGGKYVYIPENEQVDTMPPPIPFGGRQVILAEELPPEFVKQVVINDLGQLFPMINSQPGWYTIEARLPFLRFAEIIPVKNFGVLGPVDDLNNIWRGTVLSNKIQFYRYPATGGQVRVRVVQSSATQSLPLFQVPVKLFKSDDVDAAGSLEAAWTKAKVVLEGTTDNKGWAQWNSGASPCLIGDNYSIVARYAQDYQDSSIAAVDDKWLPECTGAIERTVTFAAAEPLVLDDLAARAKSGKVQLVWTPTDAVSYNVYRGTAAGGPYDFLASAITTYATYLDLAVTNGVTYYYVVRPVDQNNVEHDASNEASATPLARTRTR
jgi:hypothetical protein